LLDGGVKVSVICRRPDCVEVNVGAPGTEVATSVAVSSFDVGEFPTALTASTTN
jgi:hypothetical protein